MHPWIFDNALWCFSKSEFMLMIQSLTVLISVELNDEKEDMMIKYKVTKGYEIIIQIYRAFQIFVFFNFFTMYVK